MIGAVLVTPEPWELGRAHQVIRDQRGHLVSVRCPAPVCGRLVYVDGAERMAVHPYAGDRECLISGAPIIDMAHP